MKLGEVMITKRVYHEINMRDLALALDRYTKKDWGLVDKEDWEANDAALKEGGRLLGVYKDREDRKFWIITEADRSVTTVLLPEEY